MDVEDAKRRFRREAMIWSFLNHINILAFIGMVDIANESYLVSSWLEYGDLSKFVPARLRYLKLPSSQRLSHASRDGFEKFDEWNVIFGIVSGLAYLHRNCIIHGEVKAANVLLDIEVRPALCDFGMTNILEGAESVTSTSDVYALGMTIAEVKSNYKPS
ncbi:hypothetical protein FRB94_011002 [Tulasnella sp. JGI-2019a]|nr:hypothetical protein FRB94_011002 [Tulasnella sp. JGI-2019a]